MYKTVFIVKMKPVVINVTYFCLMVIMTIAGNERYLLISLGKNTIEDVESKMAERPRNVKGIGLHFTYALV